VGEGSAGRMVGGEATPLGTRVRGWRWQARARMSQRSPYLVLARKRYARALATSDTELVIDGFPRSGNTFAVVAFQLAQPSPTRVSHHIHSTANILAAIKRGTPVVATVRRPQEAVLSCVIREPYVSISQALNAYIAFYARLQPWHDRIVVADFGQITTDMGAVIDRVNRRFRTTFATFAHTPQSVAQSFEIIEDRARRPSWAEDIEAFLSGTGTLDHMRQAATRSGAGHARALPIPEHRVPRPSPHRQQRKRELQTVYATPDLARLCTKAEQAYAAFAPTS
jgi:hypothetical protein